jgi:hypothetical protein
MTYPIDFLLTNTNYFSWESHMEDVLRSKGLHQITLGKEQEPIDDDKYAKWINRNDEACGIIKMFISLDLRFNLQGLDVPIKLEKNLQQCLVNTILFEPISWKMS